MVPSKQPQPEKKRLLFLPLPPSRGSHQPFLPRQVTAIKTVRTTTSVRTSVKLNLDGPLCALKRLFELKEVGYCDQFETPDGHKVLRVWETKQMCSVIETPMVPNGKTLFQVRPKTLLVERADKVLQNGPTPLEDLWINISSPVVGWITQYPGSDRAVFQMAEVFPCFPVAGKEHAWPKAECFVRADPTDPERFQVLDANQRAIQSGVTAQVVKETLVLCTALDQMPRRRLNRHFEKTVRGKWINKADNVLWKRQKKAEGDGVWKPHVKQTKEMQIDELRKEEQRLQGQLDASRAAVSVKNRIDMSNLSKRGADELKMCLAFGSDVKQKEEEEKEEEERSLALVKIEEQLGMQIERCREQRHALQSQFLTGVDEARAIREAKEKREASTTQKNAKRALKRAKTEPASSSASSVTTAAVTPAAAPVVTAPILPAAVATISTPAVTAVKTPVTKKTKKISKGEEAYNKSQAGGKLTAAERVALSRYNKKLEDAKK